jgi:NAD-dependent deacetylase
MTVSPSEMDQLDVLCRQVGDGLVLILTGAGLSAESGIPTFRGPEGYWTVGAREYHPMDLATFAAFQRMPDDVWSWYLYRRATCRAAQPNPAHLALVELERSLGDRFLLLTQNVDGLHVRAGNSIARTYAVHGNIDFMRCAAECRPDIVPVPVELDRWKKASRLGDEERGLLACPRCRDRMRPHVLWFDETYDEPHYRWDSSLAAARRAAMLVVVGTSGATNLPDQVVRMVASRGRPLIVVNLDASPFSELAEQSSRGLVLRGRAGEVVPTVVQAIVGASRRQAP